MRAEVARLHRGRGRFSAAERHELGAWRVYGVLLGPSHRLVAGRLSELALIHHNARAYDKAESYYQRALAIHEAELGPDSVPVARALGNPRRPVRAHSASFRTPRHASQPCRQ